MTYQQYKASLELAPTKLDTGFTESYWNTVNDRFRESSHLEGYQRRKSRHSAESLGIQQEDLSSLNPKYSKTNAANSKKRTCK